MEGEGRIYSELKDSVCTIILDNPRKLNCLNLQMMNQLNKEIDLVSKDSKIEILIFKGKGVKAFSTGADLNQFRNLKENEIPDWIRLGNEIFNKLERLTIPTIAFLNGYVMGGGLELALACDFRLGTDSLVIKSPELSHGWLPGWGGISRLKRTIGETITKQLIFLNQSLDSKTSFSCGLLDLILDEGFEEEQLESFIKPLKKLDKTVFSMAKSVLRNRHSSTLESDIQFDILATFFSKNQETKNQ